MKTKSLPPKLQVWVDARKKYHLSDAHIIMARELGLNPKKFGKLANYQQEPWKEPLPNFIEKIYQKRFSKTHPDKVISIEKAFSLQQQKKAKKKDLKKVKTENETIPIQELINDDCKK